MGFFLGGGIIFDKYTGGSDVGGLYSSLRAL